jgi:hypothetical protein
MSAPTAAQIRAVRQVIHDRARHRAMAEDIQQINLLMNLNPTGPPLSSTDVRVAAGDGPEWRIPATGALDPAVVDAVARCEDLAKRFESMSQAIGNLDLPHDDRRSLVTALHESALTWTTRATFWRDPEKPRDPKGTVAAITAHQVASDAAAAKVKAYLVSPDTSNLAGS